MMNFESIITFYHRWKPTVDFVYYLSDYLADEINRGFPTMHILCAIIEMDVFYNYSNYAY